MLHCYKRMAGLAQEARKELAQHTQVLTHVPALEREKPVGFTTVSLPTCQTDELSPLEMPVAKGNSSSQQHSAEQVHLVTFLQQPLVYTSSLVQKNTTTLQSRVL